MEITKRNTDLKVLTLNQTGAKSGLSIRDFEKVMTYVLDQYGALSEIVPLGEKWQEELCSCNRQILRFSQKKSRLRPFFTKL